MIEFIGWMGTTFLIVCGLPQLTKLWLTKKTEGLSLFMLYLCWSGLVCMLIYESFTTAKIPLVANYTFSVILVTILIASVHYYRHKERN
jgi:uncharacterized protein with PQ loop repeat